MPWMSPLGVSGCMMFLWSRVGCYTTAGGTTACTNGANVGRMTDLSGNARHADNSTAGLYPLWQSAGINNTPSVRFDGVNDRLVTGAFTVPTVCTIVVVGFANAAATYFCDGNTGNTRVVQLDTTTTASVYAGTGLVGVATANATTPRVYSAVVNGASSQVRQNGTMGSTGNAGNAAETAGMVIGDYGGGGFTLNGDIAAVVLYDKVLSTVELDFVQQFFKQAHAIA